MLFNSQVFLLVFLPVTVVVYFLLKKTGARSLPVAWLVAASLFFYGWWNPAYLGLILGSIAVNYSVGHAIESTQQARRRRLLTFAGVSFNLALLGYFKYAGFFAETLAHLTGVAFDIGQVALPLAISFFTFQQIAYLMDASRGEVRETRFLHYCLFVTFFPQLIAGPIVHHKEMMPQFALQERAGFSVHVSDDSWTQTAVTWSNQPANNTTQASLALINTGWEWKTVDLTTFVQAEVSGDGVVSLIFKQNDGQSNMWYMRSLEHADKSYIEIEY